MKSKMLYYLVAFFLTASIDVASAQVNCSLIECPEGSGAPVCAESQELLVPQGGCCEVCVDLNTTTESEVSLCEQLPTCPPGYRCEVQSSEASCVPDCDINNGGCPLNLTCQLWESDCLLPPCPLEKKCINPCTGGYCEAGHHCEVHNGRAYCRPDCTLNNGGCPLGTNCYLQCTTTPCFPQRVCHHPSCPPVCSREFCDGALLEQACSRLGGSSEGDDCSGPCQIGYCSQCYFSNQKFIPFSLCQPCNGTDYAMDSLCYFLWAKCVNKWHRLGYGSIDYTSEEQFRCYSPPCRSHSK